MYDSNNSVLPWHNPYHKPYLAFYIHDKNISTNLIPNTYEENGSDSMFKDIRLVSNLDLDTQTIHPILSLGVIMPIMLLFAVSAIFIQMRTLQMLKHENSVNNPLMVTQARIHIIFWPSIVIVNTLADNIYPLMTLTTPYFCAALSFFFYFCVLSMILYSFYAALLRYLCTVRTERVDQFGKDRLIRMIYCIFYLHTSVWALYTILTSFNTDHLPLINSCYGYADRVFMMEHSTLEMLQRHFCAHDMDEGKNIFHFHSYYLIYYNDVQSFEMRLNILF